MKRNFLGIAALGILAIGSSASAQLTATFTTAIDVSSQVTNSGANNGIHLAHIAVDDSGVTPVIYSTTLNNSAGVVNIPALKIVDPLGTPVVTTLDTTDGLASAGVSLTRGYGGVAVDGAGNVFVAWSGNGNDDSARVRRYDTAGAQTGEWLFATLNDRLAGIDTNAAGTGLVGARFFSTATKTGHYAITDASTLVRTTAATPATVLAANPRDVAFDETNDIIYINANGNLEAITAANPTDVVPATEWAGGTSAVLQNVGANSFAGHGVGINADGSLIAFSPDQNATFGANTLRIVNPAGTTLETIGVLDTSGTFGSDPNLFRPTDAAFFSTGGNDYIAVNDTDLDDQHRIAIYQLTDPSSSVADWAVYEN